MDIHIFEPQGISFLETESTFMTNKLAEALTTSQNKTKVGLLGSVDEGSQGPVLRLDFQRAEPLIRISELEGLVRFLCPCCHLADREGKAQGRMAGAGLNPELRREDLCEGPQTR